MCPWLNLLNLNLLPCTPAPRHLLQNKLCPSLPKTTLKGSRVKGKTTDHLGINGKDCVSRNNYVVANVTLPWQVDSTRRVV